jgi:hypothetical protein
MASRKPGTGIGKGHQPLTSLNIPQWREIELPRFTQLMMEAGRMPAGSRAFKAGKLHTIVSPPNERQGWMFSISHQGKQARYPTWDEVTDARYKLLPDNILMAMLLPPRDQYVNLESATFTAHQIVPEEMVDHVQALQAAALHMVSVLDDPGRTPQTIQAARDALEDAARLGRPLQPDPESETRA